MCFLACFFFKNPLLSAGRIKLLKIKEKLGPIFNLQKGKSWTNFNFTTYIYIHIMPAYIYIYVYLSSLSLSICLFFRFLVPLSIYLSISLFISLSIYIIWQHVRPSLLLTFFLSSEDPKRP